MRVGAGTGAQAGLEGVARGCEVWKRVVGRTEADDEQVDGEEPTLDSVLEGEDVRLHPHLRKGRWR